MSPDVLRCPFRMPSIDPEVAECRRLRQLSGIEEDSLCRVRSDLCTACCAAALPPAQWLNPALASRLHDLARIVLDRGGVSGCASVQAARLLGWAEEHLFVGQRDPLAGRTRSRGARAPRPGLPRVGLVGWNTPSGLGALNRSIARSVAIDRWLIAPHPDFRALSDPRSCRVLHGAGRAPLEALLDGLDWLLLCEHTYTNGLIEMAVARDVKIAFVPMWEYFDETAPWLRAVDLMICPTRHTHALVQQCRDRLAMDWDVVHVSWPIDLDRFPFRERTTCRAFLYVHGNGGIPGDGAGGSRPPWDGRKGLGIVAEAARLAPEIPIVVRLRTRAVPPLPPNVVVRCADPDEPAALYDEGDVCIQPSRWEGLGLPLLECQASGLPLVTTDAAPMNEHRPLRRIPCIASKLRLFGARTIDAHEADPAALAAILRALYGTDIRAASRAARRFVEQEHSWSGAFRLGELREPGDWPLHPRVESNGQDQAD
jgi:glycosyltransferase involved in cell wall biosynthesis